MKINKWERNYNTVKKAQERAKNLIEDLTEDGYIVRSSLIEFVERPLKSRYTEKQVKTYLGLTNKLRIKSAAISELTDIKASQRNIKEVNVGSFVGHADVEIPRYQQKIHVRKEHEKEDLAKGYYRSMKFALSKHPNKDIDLIIWRAFHELKKVGLKSDKYKLKQGEMLKYVKSISEKDFIESYIKYVDLNKTAESDMGKMRHIFYAMGRGSEQAYKNYRDIAFEQAKLTFGEDFNRSDWTIKEIDKLYDFFKNSTVWSNFKKSYFDSDQDDANDQLRQIANSNKSISELDDLMLKSDSLSELLNNI